MKTSCFRFPTGIPPVPCASIIAGLLALFVVSGASDGTAQEEAPGGRAGIVQVLDISGYEVEFGEIGAIAVGPNGDIYVADVLGGVQEIVQVMPGDNGVTRRTLVGAGPGPGELRGLQPTLAWAGRNLVAVDAPSGQRRGLVISPEGTVLGDTRWSTPPQGWTITSPRLFDGSENAFVLEFSTPWGGVLQASQPQETVDPRAEYGHVSSTGSRTAIDFEDRTALATGRALLRNSVLCRSHDKRVMSGFAPPFTDRGPLRAILDDSIVVIPEPERPMIRLASLFRSDVDTVRYDATAVRLSDADWNEVPEIAEVLRHEALWGGELHAWGDEARPCPVLTMRPQFHPIARTVITDDASRIWLEIYGRAGFEFLIFTSEGALIDRFPVPERDASVSPYVRDGVIYFVTRDQLDVQGLVAYRVVSLQGRQTR